jgi:hypothetical protein
MPIVKLSLDSVKSDIIDVNRIFALSTRTSHVACVKLVDHGLVASLHRRKLLKFMHERLDWSFEKTPHEIAKIIRKYKRHDDGIDYSKEIMINELVDAFCSIAHFMCANCGLIATQSLKMKSCSKCHSVYYCSCDCQLRHWKKMHKKECNNDHVKHIRDIAVGHLSGLLEYVSIS